MLNALFPAQSDDLGAHIGTVESIKHSYLHWNARLGELLRVWFGSHLASTPYFAFINPLFCVGLLYLLFGLLFGRTPRLFITQNLSQQPSYTKGIIDFSDLAILCFILLVFMLNRGFGAIFFWAAGSLNYLWAYCLILAFCLPYKILLAKSFAPQTKIHINSTTQINTQITSTNKHSQTKTNLQATPRTKENLKSCAMLALGILAGLSSEFGIVLIIFLATLFAFAFHKGVKLPTWAYFGIVGLAIGFCALYFSPGHAQRAEVVKNLYGGYASLSEIWAMSVSEKYARFVLIFSDIKKMLLPLIATLGVLAFIVFSRFVSVFVGALLLVYVVCICVKWGSFGSLAFLLLPSAALLCMFAYRTSQENKQYFLILAGLFLAHFITASATIQVALPNRAKVIFTIIGIAQLIIVARIYAPYLSAKSKIIWQNLIIGFCALCALFVLYASLDMRLKWERMLATIDTQKALGKQEIIVSKEVFHSFYRNYTDWGNPTQNPNEWPNTSYARHFEVESFIAK